jgi:hypothetical protein
MIDNPFDGEIYVKSRCISQENTILSLVRDLLISLDFEETGQWTWRREDKRVVLCLVDDFNNFKNTISADEAAEFNSGSIVLTENFVHDPGNHVIVQLPFTFYSTFSYTPDLLDWQPERDLHLFMNRGDEQRTLLFNQFRNCRDLTTKDYIRYNAAQSCHESYRNYCNTIEEACVQSYLNLIVETYASSTSIALSEKTFRALQTPAPWVLYGCLGSIEYLETLGFDVLGDVIDHSYNNRWTTDSTGKEKTFLWVSDVIKILTHLKSLDVDFLRDRCITAAEHNRQLLASWKQPWPRDFSQWLVTVVDALNS